MTRALTVLVAIVLATLAVDPAPSVPPTRFAQLADDATNDLTTRWYGGAGRWRMCVDADCQPAGNVDWAADSLTGALYVRWLATHDASLVPLFRELLATEPHYGACRGKRCRMWSDVPMWDAVAALRTYDVTHDEAALRNAEGAYRSVATSDAYAYGACPAIDYQRPRAEGGGLKTLETDANRILAAILLAQRTNRADYLEQAERQYAAVRTAFLEPETGLYTVYVFDDGKKCARLPHRYFASVNGVMIDAGLELARATHRSQYATEAHATARAIRALDDERGIFTDLQAENDVVQPLVLALFHLARFGDVKASAWIVRNAAAAAHARRGDGAYGRFFDGPPPPGAVTAWQVNGGLSLAIAAGALAPKGTIEQDDPWSGVAQRSNEIAELPATLRFTGSGIALIGTLGEHCCEPGRARVLIDGRELTNHTGIWQNKSSIGRPLPDTVLFAWRWTRAGTHELLLERDAVNSKEGGPFVHIRAALTAQNDDRSPTSFR